MSTAPLSPTAGGDGLAGRARPKTVKDLVVAWRTSDRLAEKLRRKLREVAQHAQRYRRDLLFLAQQNQLRKQQADDLRARLVAVLERQQGAAAEEILPTPDGQESVPANLVHGLLKRLRDSQAILEEYDTLLQFRESQVQELLAAADSQSVGTPGGAAQDFLISQLRKQLSQARHRVRLLTKELSQSRNGAPAASAGPADGTSAQLSQYQERVRQLEALVAQAASGGTQEKDRQIHELSLQVGPLQEAVQKLQGALEASQKRVHALESRPTVTAPVDAPGEILEEMASLQDEVGRLQEEVGHLQEENEQLRSAGPASGGVLQQVTNQLNELHLQLEEERLRRSQLEEMVLEIGILRQENAALRTGGGDPQRSEKLEAAVIDLRNKLQLAANKYQEVKQALLDKHRELNELKAKSLETEKRSEAMAPMVQTLEAALSEARAEVEKGRAAVAAERSKSAELEKRLAQGAPAAAAGGSAEELAAMEAKLKEARRSAVRAQAEAGVKRKEAAKLQEELAQVKAALAAAQR